MKLEQVPKVEHEEEKPRKENEEETPTNPRKRRVLKKDRAPQNGCHKWSLQENLIYISWMKDNQEDIAI